MGHCTHLSFGHLKSGVTDLAGGQRRPGAFPGFRGDIFRLVVGVFFRVINMPNTLDRRANGLNRGRVGDLLPEQILLAGRQGVVCR